MSLEELTSQMQARINEVNNLNALSATKRNAELQKIQQAWIRAKILDKNGNYAKWVVTQTVSE